MRSRLLVSKAEWAEARNDYEQRPDCTQVDIAKDLDISKQAVNKRIKKEGWTKVDPPAISDLACTQPTQGSKLGIRSADNIAQVIDTFSLTGNRSMACRQVGIDDQTLLEWCKSEPELQAIMRAGRDAHLIGQYRKIANAKDWHAAKEILARAPETKDQWGEVRESGPTIVLNIRRD